ncbi:MAG: GNAT family N-acetyltransferase [Cyanobacteria bacterium RUI128]|nr:GNAT family N-acetyltransferase [Cyanobacteria bacterium RUI128]
MNIDSNYRCVTPNYQNRNNSTNFTANPRASYKLFKETGNAVVCQLEKSDVPFLEQLRANIGKFFEAHNITDEAKQEIIEKALDGSVDFLRAEALPQEKARVLVAISDKKPCGILVGSGLKVDKKGGLHYSSRKNHGSKETELDFFATWDNDKKKGVGSALMDSYYRAVKGDGFDTVYIRSEVPQLSGATTFYERNGARRLHGEKQQLDLKPSDYDYVTGQYFDPKDLIVRMKTTSSRMNQTIKDTSRAMQRNGDISHASRDLADMISIEP